MSLHYGILSTVEGTATKNKKEVLQMKTYEVVYFNSLSEKVSVRVRARTEAGAFNVFRREYGYYTVISIDEVK